MHDLNRLKTNFKCKQAKKKSNFSATFRHTYIGNFLVIYRKLLAKPTKQRILNPDLYLLLNLTDIYDCLSVPEYFHLYTVLIFLYFANSFMNPILYTIRMPDFKKALLSLFRRHQRENFAIPLNCY